MAMTANPLKRTKTSDALWRGLYGIAHGGKQWVVEVDYFDFSETVTLFCDGIEFAKGRSPARFQLDPHTTIEAAMALYGMKRIHLVDGRSGDATMLRPLAGTGESLRMSFEKRHPLASRLIAILSWMILSVTLVTQVPNLVNSLANGTELLRLPLTLPHIPTFALPAWANGALSILGIAAGLDRGLRMKHNVLLD